MKDKIICVLEYRNYVESTSLCTFDALTFNELETIKTNLMLISDDQSGIRKMKDGWSNRQILGHLVDSASINRLRIKTVAVLGEFTFKGYNQNRFVETHRYQETPWASIIQLWFKANVSIVQLTQSLTEQDLRLSIPISTMETISFHPPQDEVQSNLQYLINDYWVHMEHHLTQIFSKNFNE